MARAWKRLLVAVGLFVIVGVFIWRFPPVRFISRTHAAAQAAARAFDAGRFVTEFWTNQLLPACSRAADVRVVVELLRTNPPEAEKKYARKFGLGQKWYFFVCGLAKVVSVDRGEILLCVDEDGKPEVKVECGPVFGNTVRDGCGLLDVSKFPNSQDFNMISLEINRRIEAEVLPRLASNMPGAVVKFAGCTEIDPSEPGLLPLKVIPVWVEP